MGGDSSGVNVSDRGDGSGGNVSDRGDGSGGNVSDGAQQMKLRLLTHHSPPAVRPGVGGAGGWGGPLIYAIVIILNTLSSTFSS